MREKIIYIVSPSGAVGGGMGRVKDYILESGGDSLARTRFEVLVTRDERGAAYSLLLLALAILKIWRAALGGSLALVHVNFGDKGSAFRKGLVILCARAVGATTILHLHAAELTGHYAEATALTRWFIRLPFRVASSVIVLGGLWRDWLVRDLGISPAKIDVLYNGVPIPVTKRDFLNDTSGVRRILFLGLLTERKGISDFLHALAAIGPDALAWEAVIAGNGDIPGYERKARELGLEGRARFVGWVDQAGVRSLLRDVDMMVLPSYNEGLPLVILEALGSGTPVICTPIGAIPEVLEDGRSVLFVKPGDRAALTEKISMLLADPDLRQSLSDQGQARFCQQFALDVFLESLFAIYARRFGVEIARPSQPRRAGAAA
jgi:glycosyltransferase involved in cell wall biosynthesis